MSISSTSASSALSRANRPHFKPPSFEKLDGDSDGNLTLDELIAAAPKGASGKDSTKRAEQLFKAMDTDQSGGISSAEKDAFDSKLADSRQSMQFVAQQISSQDKANIFAATDKDGSGGVSLSEFSAEADKGKINDDGLKSLFSLIDEDGDGSINETESNNFFDKLTSALNDEASTQGAGGPPPGGPPPSGPRPDGGTADSGSDGSADITLLSLAQSAYKSTSSATSADFLASIRSLFNETA